MHRGVVKGFRLVIVRGFRLVIVRGVVRGFRLVIVRGVVMGFRLVIVRGVVKGFGPAVPGIVKVFGFVWSGASSRSSASSGPGRRQGFRPRRPGRRQGIRLRLVQGVSV
jgi:hypothetical protein